MIKTNQLIVLVSAIGLIYVGLNLVNKSGRNTLGTGYRMTLSEDGKSTVWRKNA